VLSWVPRCFPSGYHHFWIVKVTAQDGLTWQSCCVGLVITGSATVVHLLEWWVNSRSFLSSLVASRHPGLQFEAGQTFLRCPVLLTSFPASISQRAAMRTSPNVIVHVACGYCLGLIWRHFDTLCTSGFADDVAFARSWPCRGDPVVMYYYSDWLARGQDRCEVAVSDCLEWMNEYFIYQHRYNTQKQ